VTRDPAATAGDPMPAELRKVADAAKGFLPDDEADALYDAAWAMAPRGPILEVGTYCGKSATFLGAAAKANGGIAFTVDHHHGSEENQPGWEWHDTELVDPVTDVIDTLPFFRRTMYDAKLEDVVVAIVGRSRPIADAWSTPLAMLFIDGGHGVEHCINDYDGWARHVVIGGVLAVHDVFEDPSDGGRAPYEHIYLPAIRDGFVEIRQVGSLRVLLKPN
jgi:predicted O-methyltransferase YrrM